MSPPPERETGDDTLDTTTLFAANMGILWVMAIALAVAGWRRHDEPWWEYWVLGNIVLGVALGVFTFERHLPLVLVVTLPNGLLVLGFGLRWRAARCFSGRPAPRLLVWGPFAGFVTGAVALMGWSYAPVFVLVNVLLAALAGATAWEFWRDRGDGLPSRYGLAAAYGIMAASFGVRVPLGIVEAGSMATTLPHDTALMLHLVVAVVHTVGSGAFALSLAYERGNAALRHAATHDMLTGLLNRRAFETELRDLMRAPGKDGFALALIDIDHFKHINDRFGHAAGDEAIRSCARLCREIVGGSGTVARIGGEEFAVCLPGMTKPEAGVLMERLRRAIATSHGGLAAPEMTVSVGLCHFSDAPDAGFDGLTRLADEALYRAKNGGRDRLVLAAA